VSVHMARIFAQVNWYCKVGLRERQEGSDKRRTARKEAFIHARAQTGMRGKKGDKKIPAKTVYR